MRGFSENHSRPLETAAVCTAVPRAVDPGCRARWPYGARRGFDRADDHAAARSHTESRKHRFASSALAAAGERTGNLFELLCASKYSLRGNGICDRPHFFVSGQSRRGISRYRGHTVSSARRPRPICAIDVYEKLVRQPIGFFERQPTGRLMSTVINDVERARGTLSETLAHVFSLLIHAIFPRQRPAGYQLENGRWVRRFSCP